MCQRGSLKRASWKRQAQKGVRGRGQGLGEGGRAEDQEWRRAFRTVGAPKDLTLGPHGRNLQLPSVPSARPSRSGMSWPMRLPTAVAKGE